MCKAGNPCTQYFGCAWNELLGSNCDLQDTGLQACAAELQAGGCYEYALCPNAQELPCQVKNVFHAYKGSRTAA